MQKELISQNILFTEMQNMPLSRGNWNHFQRQVNWRNFLSDFRFDNSQSVLWLVICLVELLTGLTGSKSPGLRSCLVTSIFEASFHGVQISFPKIHPVWGMRCLSPYTWNSSVLHLKNRINLSSGNPHNNVAIGRSSRPPSWHKDGVENSLRTAFWWLFEVEISTYSIHKQEKRWT